MGERPNERPPEGGSVAALLHAADTLAVTALHAVAMPGVAPRPAFGRRPDVMAHMEMLAEEFAGRSLLEFAHAAVIVRIRRGEAVAANLVRFHEMWDVEADRLLERLDSRWLVSACDTLIEHGRTEAERAFGLAGSLFMNTVKLGETEALLCGPRAAPDLSRLRRGEATPLFDGLTAFIPRGGDMIDNLAGRLAQVEAQGFAARLLQELFARARRHDTVFRRLGEMPTLSTSRWKTIWLRRARQLLRFLGHSDR